MTRPLLVLLIGASLVLAACGEDDGDGDSAATAPQTHAQQPADSGPVHVHGLGIDPADESLYIATHTGLFRAPKGVGRATRVGDSQQDVMGFSIPEKGRFLGSGHPAPTDTGRPPNLGLIESDDGGRTWEDISLSGEADFHVLRSAGDRVYGIDSGTGRLMVSDDAGRTWNDREPPAPTFDLAIDPEDPDHLIAATEQGLFSSSNKGEKWASAELRGSEPGLLAWPEPERLFRVDGSGGVSRSDDGGRRWKDGIGNIGGQPAAFIAAGEDLYAALPDGTIKRSTDGGESWSVRSTP